MERIPCRGSFRPLEDYGDLVPAYGKKYSRLNADLRCHLMATLRTYINDYGAERSARGRLNN